MRCGILCDVNGVVKRTWTIINGSCPIPVEDGDTIHEWELDHGEFSTAIEEKALLEKDALKEQLRIHSLRTEDDVYAHTQKFGRVRESQIIGISNSSSTKESVFYDRAKGLHYRRHDEDKDETEEIPVNDSLLRSYMKQTSKHSLIKFDAK